MKAMRWGNNDRYLGPFTYAVDPKYPHWAIILKSTDDEGRGTSLRISVGSRTLIIALPPIVRPWKRKVVASSWDTATIERLGRAWYWDIYPREYGISYSDGFLQILYGRSTHDSSTEQRWSCFLPWTQWRHVRHSYYGLSGELVATVPSTVNYALDGGKTWELARQIADAAPTVRFSIKDFDGEDLEATTKIEEREWRFGTGWFKWLSIFRSPKIRRSLDISFSGETGPEKGSWKGGMTGTSIDMLAGETHEQAFRRFCDEDHRSKYRNYRVQFVSKVVSVPETSS